MTTPTNGLAKLHLLEALVELENKTGQGFTIPTETVEAFLDRRPDLVAKLEGLDPKAVAAAIHEAFGEIGILGMIENAIQETIETAASQPDKEADRDG
jgi:hypothetical protein